MLKSLAEIIKQLLGYAKDTERNTADIRAIQAKLESVTNDMRQIASNADADRCVAAEQQRIAERDYDNLVVRLQLVMKDVEPRTLLPGSNP